MPISGNDDVINLIQKLISKHHFMAEDLKYEAKITKNAKTKK